jgi:hypothetical protein
LFYDEEKKEEKGRKKDLRRSNLKDPGVVWVVEARPYLGDEPLH